MIRDKGRLGWQKATGYGRRSLGETAMSRYKAIIGRDLRAWTLPAQKTEAKVGCSVLNRITRLAGPCPSALSDNASGYRSTSTVDLRAKARQRDLGRRRRTRTRFLLLAMCLLNRSGRQSPRR